MNQSDNLDEHKYLSKNVTALKGVGNKIKNLLKKKGIEKISDLLWNLPQGYTDRSVIQNLDKLEIGKINTIKAKVIKYNFPRIRNLPNKVICEDYSGKIEIVFFNSREGYIRKVLPLNETIIISGKINYFKNKYQIVNPDYIVPINKEDYVKKIIPKYSLTEGITEKIYRKLIEQVLKRIPNLNEWHNFETLKKIGNVPHIALKEHTKAPKTGIKVACINAEECTASTDRSREQGYGYIWRSSTASIKQQKTSLKKVAEIIDGELGIFSCPACQSDTEIIAKGNFR